MVVVRYLPYSGFHSGLILALENIEKVVSGVSEWDLGLDIPAILDEGRSALCLSLSEPRTFVHSFKRNAGQRLRWHISP